MKRDVFVGLFLIIVLCLAGQGLRDTVIIAYFLTLIYRFLRGLGQGIPIDSLILLFSCFTTLVMPLAAYRIFNEQFDLAILWKTTMLVEEDIYFDYLLPANLFLLIGLSLPLASFPSNFITSIVDKLKSDSTERRQKGILLFIVGLFAMQVLPFAPDSFRHILYLTQYLIYIGLLYVSFSRQKGNQKAFWLMLSISFLVALREAIFGDFLQFAALTILLISLVNPISMAKKSLLLAAGILFILSLQHIKGQYRKVVWYIDETFRKELGTFDQLGIFSNLLWESASNPEVSLNLSSIFYLHVRFNQGFLISHVMDYIPKEAPYDNGASLLRSLGGALLPRIIWPEKPKAGGAENIARFTRIRDNQSTSMNIGPYGEAYGNYGIEGGWIILLLYGLFLGFAIRLFLVQCSKQPELLIWMPLAFFGSINFETDIFSSMNAMIKAFIFISIIFFLMNKFRKTDI